jgi:hypothetical protein
MSATLGLEPPARQLKTLLSGMTDGQLSAPTPCGSRRPWGTSSTT